MSEGEAKELFKKLNHVIPMDAIMDVEMVDGEWELIIW